MNEEQGRAHRIMMMTEDLHNNITSVYEKLVDREYSSAKDELRQTIKDIRLLITRIEDDDL